MPRRWAIPRGSDLRLTVLGCSTAAPHPGTPTAGYLVEWGSTRTCSMSGQGVIRNLQNVLDPHDLSGDGHRPHARRPLPRPRRACATSSRGASPPHDRCRSTFRPADAPGSMRWRRAVSERAGFFDAAFDGRRVRPGPAVLAVGELRLRFVRRPTLRPGLGRDRRGAGRRSPRLHRRHRPVDRGRGRRPRRRSPARRELARDRPPTTMPSAAT